ncbi:substrate-binding periplasmic protein [Roseateles oligotrophus]|uniref:Transporter substrate-binding domain-containing protein n=1 Tax=Roseateles oligotrophus TaxID=1769250 RepID=A0ABT2YI99_9BURK|nr:transporter substrate-binding domain-containing protein [Roseateles oligotrophus]MCV2369733.1 transporter substrate-binding domain-containing protein [Roseateles oligotrophus]
MLLHLKPLGLACPALLRALLMGLSLALCSAAAGAAQTVAICVGDFQPYNSPALPQGGPVIQIAVEAMHRSGYELKVEFMPWARVLKDGSEGRCGILGIWRNAERELIFDFSQPLIQQELGFFARRGSKHEYKDAAQLTELVIGVERGSYLPPLLTSKDLRFDPAGSLQKNLLKLARGRIDLAFGAKDAGLAGLEREPELKASVEWLSPGLERKDTHLAFAKTQAQARELLAAFDKGLLGMKADGSLRKILQAAKLDD